MVQQTSSNIYMLAMEKVASVEEDNTLALDNQHDLDAIMIFNSNHDTKLLSSQSGNARDEAEI